METSPFAVEDVYTELVIQGASKKFGEWMDISKAT